MTWSPLPERVTGPNEWQVKEWAERASSKSCRTDAAGSFVFAQDEVPDAPFGSVLWITHPEYRAEAVILEAPKANLGVVQLDPAPRRWATVLAGGMEVEGARVLQLAVPKDGSGNGVRARRMFRRESTTGADGRAPLATLAGREGLFAIVDGECSRAVTRECTGDVTLELLPSFSAGGSVLLTDSEAMPEGVRVFVEVGGDEDWERESSVAVRPDRSWGPMSLPLLETSYRFVVEGGGVIRESVYAPTPDLGQELNIDIETRLGIDQWFNVLDAETGEQLPEAHIEVYAQDEFARWVMVKHHPLDNGYILARGCAPGPLHYVARCPGYAFARGGPVPLPTPEPYTIVIDLFKAGQLEGWCTWGGAPADDFKVIWWPGEFYQQLDSKVFRDLEDGHFVLENIAAGDVTLIAQSAELGQSEPITVTVPPGGTGEARIDLPGGEIGRGLVVDQASGAPIQGAAIKLFFTFGSQGVHETDVSTVTDRDGRFELPGLSTVQSTFSINAPGHAEVRKIAQAADSTAVDLGTIELPRSQPLEIRLHTPEGVDPSTCSVGTLGLGLPRTYFSSEGLVIVEDFMPGHQFLRVEESLGRTIDVRVDLRPGEDWIVDIDATGPCQVQAHVTDASGNELPEDLWVFLKHPSDRGGADWVLPVPKSGEVLFSSVPAGPIQATLRNGTSIVASKRLTLDEGQTNEVELSLNEIQRQFRVVDRDGLPLSSTFIRFLIDGNGEGRIGGRTDGHGRFSCGGLVGDSITVNLEHPTVGFASGIAVDRARAADEVVDIVLEPQGSLSVTLLDGDEPIPSIDCRAFWTNSVEVLSGNRTTDANGRVEWKNVGRGRYDFRAQHPNYWPVRVEVRAGDEPNRIQMRRRGNLFVRALEANGSKATNMPLRVVSADFQTDVAKWIEAGAVKAPLPLVTNASGEVELFGLPRGQYQWTAQSGSGETLSGTIAVSGGKQVVLPIRLP